MKTELVSLIIPFYNEEKYLKRAILSAINQTYGNIEIILINDGSKDKSLSIAEELAKTKPNLIVISIANSGLSEARNIGMEACNGKYLAFLDSDDELETNAIQELVTDLEIYNSCLSVCQFNLKKENSELIMTSGFKVSERCITNTKAIKGMYSGEITYTAWAKLYRADIAKKIFFPRGLWFEDRPFFLAYLVHSKTVSFVEKPLLSIYTTQDSITRRTIGKKRIHDIQEIWKTEMKIATANKLSYSLINAMYRNHINTLYETAILLTIDQKKIADFYKLRLEFDRILKETSTVLRFHSIHPSLKQKLHLLFLKSNRLIGWATFKQILTVKKSDLFQKINTLRQN